MGHRVYIRSKKVKAGQGGIWPEKKRMEALMAYLAIGNMVQVATVTGIPLQTLKGWKIQPWWKEATQAFHDDDKQEIDASYHKIIRKCLEVTNDRLENGNFIFDQKTGRVNRVPVTLRDSHQVMKDMVQQQQTLRKDESVEVIKEESINSRLVKLAEQFATMAMGRTEKVVEHSYEQLTASDAVLETLGGDIDPELISSNQPQAENRV